MDTDAASEHYRNHTPDRFTRAVLNPMIQGLTAMGISVLGSRTLEHRGRASGTTYRTPVNLLHFDGADYLVAPRGETQWVRNVRAAQGELVLKRGRRATTYRATEVPVADRVPVLRAYLKRWKAELGVFFDGVGPDSEDATLAAAAAKHPVFRLG